MTYYEYCNNLYTPMYILKQILVFVFFNLKFSKTKKNTHLLFAYGIFTFSYPFHLL